MTRHCQSGDRVTLRPDRADAYGLPRQFVYTVAATRPNAHYRRTWVYIREWAEPANVADSREFRLAQAATPYSRSLVGPVDGGTP